MLKLSFCYVFNDEHVVSVVCYKVSNKNCDNLTVFRIRIISTVPCAPSITMLCWLKLMKHRVMCGLCLCWI